MAKYPDRYLITAKVAADALDRSVKKGQQIWLYWSPEGGGWWQWSSTKEWAERFPSNEGNRFSDAMSCAQTVGPWFYTPDPKTIKVVAVPAIVTVS